MTALLGLAIPAVAGARARWDTKVLAHVPAPGYPAKTYVDPRGRVWEGTYVDLNGSTLPSRVFEFDGTTGAVLREFVVEGQRLDKEHGVQVATSDASGRLILIDRARASVLDPDTGRQTTYATFAQVQRCSVAGSGSSDCSHESRDAEPFADYAAWGPDGSLYVTDYAQALIWRVPPGGGTPRVWLTDALLEGSGFGSATAGAFTGFGTAGIWLLPDRRTLLISQASVRNSDDPTSGALYTMQIRPDGSSGPLRKIWESAPTDLPDGFAVAKSGNIYLCAVGLTTQIVVISSDGRELERFPRTPFTGDNGSSVPFDQPSGLAFLGTRLILANQSSLSGNAAHQALLDVEVAEEGQPEFIPANAGPVATPVRGVIATLVRRHRGLLALRLSRQPRPPGRVRVRITASGRLLATGTLDGRTLRIRLRRGVRLPTRVTLRGKGLRVAVRVETAQRASTTG
jgi:sugar lactone lactonase YvrE